MPLLSLIAIYPEVFYFSKNLGNKRTLHITFSLCFDSQGPSHGLEFLLVNATNGEDKDFFQCHCRGSATFFCYLVRKLWRYSCLRGSCILVSSVVSIPDYEGDVVG
jgi:hypothetical protein